MYKYLVLIHEEMYMMGVCPADIFLFISYYMKLIGWLMAYFEAQNNFFPELHIEDHLPYFLSPVAPTPGMK